jgi:hypothetical protein
MGNRLNPAAILAAYGKSTTSSLEENDLNVNINATHEGEDDSAATDAADLTAPEAEVIAETPVDTEEVAVVDAEDTSGTPETAELDIVDAGEEVAETGEQIEDVNDAAAGLEGILLTLARISHEGLQVTPFVASTIHQQFEFVTRKYPGLRQGKTGISSMESLVATPDICLNDSMEAVLEGLKKAKDAFVAFLTKLWDKFKAFLGSITSGSKLMIAKAKQLQNQKAGNAPSEITLPGLVGELKSAEDINYLTSYVKALSSITVEVAKTLNGPSSPDNRREVVGSLFGSLVGVSAKFASEKPILGFGKIEVGEDGLPRTVRAKDQVATKRKPFSESEAHAIAKAVVSLGEAVEVFQSKRADRKTAIDLLKKEAAVDLSGENDGAVKRWAKARLAGTLVSTLSVAEISVIRQAISVGNAVNNAVAKSLGKSAAQTSESSSTELATR